MAAKDVRAGGAFVEFSLRRKNLERSLREVGSRLRKFGGQVRQIGAGISAAGAGITAPLAASLAIFKKYGDTLDKTSKRTGVAVKSLAELQFAAEQSGSDLGTFEKGLKTAQRSIYDLGRGLSTQTDAFNELGLTFKDLDGRNPEDQFTLIADRLAEIDDPSKQAALSMVLLGRAGQQLVPLIKESGKSLEGLRNQFTDLTGGIDEASTDAAAKFTDTLNALKTQIKIVAFNIGGALAPALTSIVEKTQPILRTIIDWVKENASLVRTVAIVGVSVTALGLTLVSLGTAIGIAGFALTALAGVISVVLSPIALLIAGVVAAGVAFVKFTDTGGRAVDYLKNKFGELFKSFSAALGGIRDALAAGDIALAAEILWTNLKLVFFIGTQDLIRKAIEIKKGFLVALTETTIGAIAEGAKLYAGLQKVWNNVTAGAKSLWQNLKGDAAETFNLIRNQASKAGNAIKGALDEGFDAEGANAEADKLFVERQQGAQKQRKDALTSIEEERKAKLQQIEDEAKAREEAIQSSLKTELDAINEAEDKEKERLQNTLDGLKEKQRKLLEAAAKAAGKTKEEIAAASKEQDKLEQKRRDTLKLVADGAGVTSSFNIRALGADDINKKILKAGEDQVKELRKIKEVLSGDALVADNFNIA